MSLSDEDRKYILAEHLRSISHIADQKYQERVWLNAEGPECDDYTESICHFFDDGDPIISNYADYGIADKQLASLVRLRDELDDFNSNARFELGPDFIYSPKWAKIMNSAKDVLKAFNYSETVG
jgi:hypothetical protein